MVNTRELQAMIRKIGALQQPVAPATVPTAVQAGLRSQPPIRELQRVHEAASEEVKAVPAETRITHALARATPANHGEAAIAAVTTAAGTTAAVTPSFALTDIRVEKCTNFGYGERIDAAVLAPERTERLKAKKVRIKGTEMVRKAVAQLGVMAVNEENDGAVLSLVPMRVRGVSVTWQELTTIENAVIVKIEGMEYLLMAGRHEQGMHFFWTGNDLIMIKDYPEAVRREAPANIANHN